VFREYRFVVIWILEKYLNCLTANLLEEETSNGRVMLLFSLLYFPCVCGMAGEVYVSIDVT
jgi:hypothetical protein